MCGRIWSEEDINMFEKQVKLANKEWLTIIECCDGVFRDVFSVKRIVRNFYDRKYH